MSETIEEKYAKLMANLKVQPQLLSLEERLELKYKIMESYQKTNHVYLSHTDGIDWIKIPRHVDIADLCREIVADSCGALSFKMFPAEYTKTSDAYLLRPTIYN